jgi:Nucleotidyltransferase domain.
MPLYSWAECPQETKNQIASLKDGLIKRLGSNLAGLYVHGSLALNSFNPANSDIDVIVLVQEKLDLDTRFALVEELLQLSLSPSPIEISFITRSAIEPWQHPAPFELHCSEFWRERYEERIAAGDRSFWSETPTDGDLACHLTLVRRSGIHIFGLSIEEAIPEVPEEDFLSSILSDVTYSVNALHTNAVYGILTLCRVLSYLVTGEIMSKREAGLWGITRIPENLRYIVNSAVEVYEGSRQEMVSISDSDLTAYGQLMSDAIASYQR